MNRSLQGKYITVSTVGEKADAYLPLPLPPVPPIEWSSLLRDKFDKSHLALGRLDSVTILLPDISLFLYMYVRKEAVLSSQIEGTQSSLAELLLFEMDEEPGVPIDDVQEISNYVAALNYGIRKIEEGFPICLRLIKEIHAILLSKGRGSQRNPGEFRRSQNWIGGSRPGNAIFVPPPPEYIPECMGKLELFLNDQPEKTPVLVKAALAHLQFETIHPFLDGNGRLGRLLITLLLCAEKVLKSPLLYLSLYFKQQRQRYYDLLNHVRLTGDWESWLEFFADAVTYTAAQAVETAQRLIRLSTEDQEQINKLGRAAGSVLRVHRVLSEHPIASAKYLSEKTELSPATVNTCLDYLKKLAIIKELTGRKRNRIFSYSRYIEIIKQGTEL